MSADRKPMFRLEGKFSLRPPEAVSGELVDVFPYKRSILGSLFIFGFLCVFCTPYFTFGDFRLDDGSLFSLIFTLFSILFLIGWSTGVAVLLVMFLGSILGQERITLSDGRLTVRLEILGLGLSQSFSGNKILDMQWFDPPPHSSVAWRGPHMVFFYEGRQIEFGSKVDQRTGELLLEDLRSMVLGKAPAEDAAKSTDHQKNKSEPSSHDLEGLTLTSASVLALILANLVPVAGVLFFSWSVGDVMLLYWGESAIIGLFNVAKMWVVDRTASLFMGPFFFGHYGGFMVVHLLFIYGLMVEGGSPEAGLLTVAGDFVPLVPAFVALLISHGVSYVTNFLGRREYEARQMTEMMSAPYRRVIVMHMTLIFGGFLVMTFGTTMPALLLMISLKIFVDARAHIAEHRGRES